MDLIRTEMPEEAEVRAVEALISTCNENDGTSYCADEADDYFLLYEEDQLLSALMVYHMGDTLDGAEIDEIAAYTLPEERGNGFFTGLLEEALPESRPVIRFSVYENPDALAVLEKEGAFKKNEEILMEYDLTEISGAPACGLHCSGCEGACVGAVTAETVTAEAVTAEAVNAEAVAAEAEACGREEETCPDESQDTVRDGRFCTDHAELSYRIGADSVYIYGVSAYERGRGYGTELMEKAKMFFAPLGARKMFLEVSSDNLPAVRLYQKTGFRKVAAVACWYLRNNIR